MNFFHRAHQLETPKQNFINLTRPVQELVRESGVKEGHCTIFCPHTTAAITLNEGTDPAVVTDLLYALDQTFPNRPQFDHLEGNSAAHLKATMVGCSQTIPIVGGRLLLGRWQSIFFCEFDGPRTRTVHITIQGSVTAP